MKLLTDRKLIDYLTPKHGVSPIIQGIDPPDAIDSWFKKNSHVQPASIDLTVGAVYRPEDGGQPAERRVMRPGHTVVVRTRESINFPARMCAFGFPPARVSKQGLLMTNPGHVDPGFVGPLSFTVINMSREDFTLHEGDPIVTLLVFEMDDEPEQDYHSRYGRVVPNFDYVAKLTKDFMNVGQRVKSEMKNAGYLVTTFAVIIAAFVPLAFNRGCGVDQLRNDLNTVKQELQLEQERRNLLEQRLARVEEGG